MTLSAADLTPDQLAGSWRNDGCDYCQQTTGHRCRTSSDNLCPPHTNRRVKYAAFLNGQASRQTEVAGLAAQVTSLKAANDQLDATLAGADAQNDTLAKRVTTLTAQLADAQARIAQLEQPPEPAEPTTLYGMNLSAGTTAFTSAPTILATFGGLPVAKVFYQGALPATFSTNYEGRVAGKVAAVCFKPSQDALANGSLDAAITGYVKSIPPGWKIMLVNWQEPDDEMWVSKAFTVAAHHAATDHLCDLVHAADPTRARAEVWDIYMGYSLDAKRFDTAAVSIKLDGIGWDYYWNSAKSAASDPLASLKKMADATTALGIKQWGLFETGDNPDTFKDGATRAAFWTKVFDGAATLGYRYCCYFNAIGTTGDHRIVPGQPYSEPLLGVLKARMS